jgi:hypothetical protein
MLDLLTIGVNALWAALEADDLWCNYFLEKNRIKYSRNESTSLKKILGTTTDFPNVAITPGSFSDDLFSQTETFATFNSEFNALGDEWLETITLEHVITIHSRTIAVGDADPAGILTLRAIRRGGPKLKTPQISQIGKVTGMAKEGDRREGAGTIRWDFTIRVPITFQLEGRDLVS